MVITEPPRLAVEIMAPSQTLDEMSKRIDLLLDHGVPSEWLIIPLATGREPASSVIQPMRRRL